MWKQYRCDPPLLQEELFGKNKVEEERNKLLNKKKGNRRRDYLLFIHLPSKTYPFPTLTTPELLFMPIAISQRDHHEQQHSEMDMTLGHILSGEPLAEY